MKKSRLALLALAAIMYFNCRNKTLNTFIDPVLGMEFVLIPKGSFQMGENILYTDSLSAWEHRVYLSKNYWLGKQEVTESQWQNIMGTSEYHTDKPSPFHGLNPNYPIVSVSYFDVEKFIDKLNAISHGYHYRLPTEAEWEYACRAGTTTPYSYGLTLTDSLAKFNAELPSGYSSLENISGHPEPVGSYPPNPWGLYDMHGNVWEWVSDWYAPYPHDDVTNPIGPKAGKEKVIRGGSWYFGAQYARSAFRKTHEPGLWGFSIGFRLVCEKTK